MTTRPLPAVLLTSALLLVACGQQQIETGGAEESSGRFIGCDATASDAVEALSSGLPAYDYDPAPNTAALAADADLVVSGTLLSASRVETSDPASGDETLTVVQAAEWLPVGSNGPVDGADGLRFSFAAERPNDDPLADGVSFDPAFLRFLAFLYQSRTAPGGYVVGVQGLVIACGQEPAEPVIEPLPGDAAGLTVDELTDTVLAAIGPEPETFGPVRPIPFRLLSEGDPVGEPWSTRVVRSEADLGPLATEVEVDWENEAILAYTLAESGSCPFGPVEDLEFDEGTRRLYPVVDLAEDFDGCTSDANPHLVLVAVARQDLPVGDFTLWVDRHEPPSGVQNLRTEIRAGELTGPDSNGLDYPPLRDGGGLAIGETKTLLDLSTHCGLGRLYWTIEGRQWVLETGEQSVSPPEWAEVERDESIDVIVERSAEDLLIVTAIGTDASAVYVPASELQGCD